MYTLPAHLLFCLWSLDHSKNGKLRFEGCIKDLTLYAGELAAGVEFVLHNLPGTEISYVTLFYIIHCTTNVPKIYT